MSLTKKSFVTVAGNIGSGKTTLTERLAQRYGWTPHYEVVSDNPYLSDFYDDMPRWSLPLQVFFLSKRFNVHRSIVNNTIPSIQDRSIYEDAHIFAKALFRGGNMEQRDFENYLELYETMILDLDPPDLVIYLRASVPTLRSRIKQRGRKFEEQISTEYLKLLNNHYEEWIEGYHMGRVLTLETDGVDFREDHAFKEICEHIEEALKTPRPKRENAHASLIHPVTGQRLDPTQLSLGR